MRTRRRVLLVLVALTAVIAARSAAITAAVAVAPAQIGMLVRFHELPGGYVIGDEEIGCGIIDPEAPSRR